MNLKTEPEVKLLNYLPNPEITVAKAALLAYDKNGLRTDISLEDARKIIRRIPRKHKSIYEHALFQFYITGTRVMSHQLVRHRMASFTQRSQRYVNESSGYFMLPKELIELMGKEEAEKRVNQTLEIYKNILEKYKQKGITGERAHENARYFLIPASQTHLIMTVNASSLNNFLNLRMCNRAQEEIRKVAYRMFELVYPIAPTLFEKSGPDCISGKCSEGKRCCGLQESVLEKITKIIKKSN